MSTQGYVTMAIDAPQSTQQIRAAYSLACSLRLVDADREIALVTDKFKNIPRKYEDAFDYIVELPYGVTDSAEPNRAHNLWQVYYCTPFDETMYINPASIAVDNVKEHWRMFEYDNIVFPRTTVNFKQQVSTYWSGRSVFEKNSLPDIHSDVFYFERSKESADFFKMADIVFQNWRALFFEHIKEERPASFDADVAFALTGYMLGEQLVPTLDLMQYTDLTLYNLPEQSEDQQDKWLNDINVWFFAGHKTKVNNHRQTGLFVYHDFDLMTEETTNELRKYRKNATTKL
jgi:hypothetical protein